MVPGSKVQKIWAHSLSSPGVGSSWQQRLIPREGHSSCLLSDGHEAVILAGVRSSLQPWRSHSLKSAGHCEKQSKLWTRGILSSREFVCVFRSLLLSVLGLCYCWDPNIGSLIVLEDIRLSFNSGSFIFLYTHSWHQIMLKPLYGH